MNVQKASLSQMLENNECASIIQVIGAGSGASFSLDDALLIDEITPSTQRPTKLSFDGSLM